MSESESTLAGRLAFAALCLMVVGLAFSISIAQTGLGIAFILFVGTLFSSGRKTLRLRGAKWLKLFYVFIAGWIIWRIFHVLIAARPGAELFAAREVWLMLIPVFIWFYASSRNRLRLLLTLFVLGAAVSSAWGLWKMRNELFDLLTRGKGLTTMHHLNYAGVAAFAALLGLGLSWSNYYCGNQLRALLILLFALLAFAGLWLTKSKGAIAAFAAVIPLFIYLQLHNRVHRWLFIALTVGGAAYLLPRLPESITAQYRFPPPEIHAGSQAERRDLWQTGLAMIRDNPWVGYGERGYNEAFPRYQLPEATGVARWDEKSREASHMHNDFLNTWVLYGAIGLLLQLGYYFVGFFAYLRERYRIRRQSDRPLAAAGASSAVLMALMGLTQCHFTSEIVQMSFWIALGSFIVLLDCDRSGYSGES
jgi:O-antigen ligase